MKDRGDNIINMIETCAGEHCLFRSFGLDGVTDRRGILTRADIQSGISKWYPRAELKSFKINKDGKYEVDVREV